MRRAALAVLALVAACGTTVPMTGSAPTSQLGGDGLDPASTAGTTGLPTTEANPGAGNLVTGGGSNATSPPSSSDSATLAPTSGSTGRGSYTGVTPTTITIGLSVASTAGSAGAQLGESYGIGGFSSGPDKPLLLALVDWFNRHGGVAGRKLLPVFHPYDGNDLRPYAVQDQEACTAFTQDKHVFAHLADVVSSTFYACMEKAGTVGVERYELGAQTTALKHPGIFSVSDLDYTSSGRVLIEALIARGFLSKQDKIGLVQTDSPDMESARSAGMDPALAKAGLRFLDIARVSPVQQTSDAAGAIQALGSAVLKFHTDQITKVLFLTPNGALLDAIFMKQAENQGYRPKYGLSSKDAPVGLGGGNAPDAQLAGSGVIGWSPLEDLRDVPSSQVPAAQRHCLQILREEKLSPPTDRGQVNQFMSYCGAFQLFATIAGRAGAQLNRNSFIRAGSSLGTAYQDPFSITGYSRITAGSHQAVAEYQPLAFNGGCECFTRAGAVVRFR
ncbi:MAG: hypothetical protein JWM40_2464 [Frankiales bacterium]|nr:hypothetical protein [Frankiales bacterium]